MKKEIHRFQQQKYKILHDEKKNTGSQKYVTQQLIEQIKLFT